MRIVVIGLAVLLLGIQWPLWFGKGGWLRVAELNRQVEVQRATHEALTARNADLAAELDSLRQGREAIEERARLQMNMIRSDELFFQVVPAGGAATKLEERR
jgi:cell division protein FtsB